MQTLSWVVLNMRHTSVLTKKKRKKVKIGFQEANTHTPMGADLITT